MAPTTPTPAQAPTPSPTMGATAVQPISPNPATVDKALGSALNGQASVAPTSGAAVAPAVAASDAAVGVVTTAGALSSPGKELGINAAGLPITDIPMSTVQSTHAIVLAAPSRSLTADPDMFSPGIDLSGPPLSGTDYGVLGSGGSNVIPTQSSPGSISSGYDSFPGGDISNQLTDTPTATPQEISIPVPTENWVLLLVLLAVVVMSLE